MMQMETDSIITFALQKLAGDERSTLQIAHDCGLKYRWLQKLRNGEVPKPGAHLIDKLARYYGFYKDRPVVKTGRAA